MDILGYQEHLRNLKCALIPNANRHIGMFLGKNTGRGKEMSKSPETRVDEHGYLRYLDSNYLVHRRVMEKKLGHRLVRGEIVHHINGNKLDNRPENLEVITAKEHYKRHVVPILEERRQAQIIEKLTPQLEAQGAKAIMIGFAAAGAVLFIVGLITKGKLDMWYIGLAFLLAAIFAWYFVWRKSGN